MLKTTITLFISIILFSCSILAQTSPAYGIREKTPDIKALVDARIVVNPELTIESGTLLIKEGRVIDVGENIIIPSEAFIINLSGYTIYPGFIESFTSYGLKQSKLENLDYLKFQADRNGGKASNEAIHPEIKWVNHFTPDEKSSEELMKLGFTVVQSALHDGIFRGQSFITHLGRGLSTDLIIRANSHQFCSFNKGTSQQQNPSSLMGSIALIRQAFYDTDWYKQAHQAYNLNPRQKAPEYNSALEALSNYKNTTFRIEGNNVFKDGLFFGFLVCMTDKEITIRHRDKRITKLILS